MFHNIDTKPRLNLLDKIILVLEVPTEQKVSVEMGGLRNDWLWSGIKGYYRQYCIIRLSFHLKISTEQNVKTDE